MAVRYSRVEVVERLTADDFWRDAPENRKAELINGVIVMPSPASIIHEQLLTYLVRLLGDYVEQNRLGTVLGSRAAVQVAPNQVLEPDVLFVARARSHIIKTKGLVGAPDLVIEVLSASTAAYDRGDKLHAYERAGVRELWLIDPYGPTGTEFFQLQRGRFVPIMADAQNRITSLALLGFWIDVRWLWPETGEFVPVAQALAQIAAQ